MKEWNISFSWPSFVVGVMATLMWNDILSVWWCLSFPVLITTTPWEKKHGIQWRRGRGWSWMKPEEMEEMR